MLFSRISTFLRTFDQKETGYKMLWQKHWLLVWNMTFICPYLGNVIIPIDFHIFQMARSITNQNTSGFNVPGDSQPARRNGARRNGRARSKSRSGNGHRNGWLWLGKRWVGENAKFYLIFESFGEEVYMFVCIYIYIYMYICIYTVNTTKPRQNWLRYCQIGLVI